MLWDDFVFIFIQKPNPLQPSSAHNYCSRLLTKILNWTTVTVEEASVLVCVSPKCTPSPATPSSNPADFARISGSLTHVDRHREIIIRVIDKLLILKGFLYVHVWWLREKKICGGRSVRRCYYVLVVLSHRACIFSLLAFFVLLYLLLIPCNNIKLHRKILQTYLLSLRNRDSVCL